MNDLFLMVWRQKILFFSTFFVIFTISYIVLLALDFLPEPPVDEDKSIIIESEIQSVTFVTSLNALFQNLKSKLEREVSESFVVATTSIESEITSEDNVEINLQTDDVLPLQITIQRLNKTITVLNPTSRSIADLDEALLTGVVRHPDSATLAQEGNIFILGHSSYLPNVFNKNYQAFNGIQNLEWGDTIEVYSESAVYTYRVEKVYRARAQDVTVPIAGTGNMLTLATCNSFGSIDDRYIVEAVQKNVRSL